MQEQRAGEASPVQASQETAPLCIAGMHRSGTSMVAQALQQAGLFLGEATDLMPPAAENPEGFFEHLGLVRLNDELLNAAGGGWDCPPPAGFAWTDPNLDAFRERARALATPLAVAAWWGWKDPRNSLTLPFWQSAFGPLQTLVVVRNPLEVVTSLHRRDGFSAALGLTLWQIYTERIVADTAPEDRVVTHFDTWFLRPAEEVRRVLSRLGRPTLTGTGESPSAPLPALRHHQRTLRDLIEHEFPRAVVDLYRQLCEEAEWWEGQADLESFTSVPASLPARASDSIVRGLGRVDVLRIENEALRRNNADFTARIRELENALAVHESSRAELEGKVAERDSKVNERNALLIQQGHTIAALREQVTAHEREAAGLREDLTARERDLEIAMLHEREQRAMLTATQAIQMQRDAEIMGVLGAVLSRHAPGAPASIYHRRLVVQMRGIVEATVPADAAILVATYGDDAFLTHGARPSAPFPVATDSITADYNDISSAAAIAQLEASRGGGAEYLVVPGTALPWLANHPDLERHLDDRYEAVYRERGVATIYALGRRQGQIPA